MLKHICGQLISQTLRHGRMSSISISSQISFAHTTVNYFPSHSLHMATARFKETIPHNNAHEVIDPLISTKITETQTNEEQPNLFKIDDPQLAIEEWQEIGDPIAEEVDEFQGISLEHGQTGVFDIEDLVDILRAEKLQNIAVVAVPKELQYVDYMVITTGKSPRQMTAVAGFIRKIFKNRRSASERIPNVEGKDNKDWIALDLGNIALHIFSAKYRKIYDLETLWTCGAKYDELSNQDHNNLASLMESNSFTSSI